MIILLAILLFQIRAVDFGLAPTITRVFPSEEAPDIALERALQNRETFSRGDFYLYNKVDLNGDGDSEVIVYVIGRWVCGSGGCPMFIMRKADASYVCVTEMSQSFIPIVVSNDRTKGWNDLIIWQRSFAWDSENKVGKPSQYVVLRFDGRSYPTNPTVGTSKALASHVTGIAYLANPEKPESGVRINHNHK